MVSFKDLLCSRPTDSTRRVGASSRWVLGLLSSLAITAAGCSSDSGEGADNPADSSGGVSPVVSPSVTPAVTPSVGPDVVNPLVAPDPVSPAAVDPAVTPDPVAPDPVAPDPVAPDPVAPAISPTQSGAFTLTITASSVIQTVGIAEWSTTESVDSAVIRFGRDASNLEFEAPVDMTSTNYRTLLLGMKPNQTYYVQVIAQGGGTEYASETVEFQSGPLPNGLPIIDVADTNASALYGGFTTNCTGIGGGGAGGGFAGAGGGGGGNDSWVFMFDKDGDQVWAYNIGETAVAACTRARMSYDGKHMWIGNFSNVSTDGALVRVTMDGLEESDPYSLPGRHHDFAILPNNHVLFYEQANGGGYTNGSEGPDVIYELDPETGQKTQLYDEMTDFAEQINESGAHTNQINYVPELNAISFSLRHTSTIGLISYPEAQLLAVFGGPSMGYGISWDIQHGHHVTDSELWVFNNNGSNGGSSILGFSYDMSTMAAPPILDYSSGKSSGAFGDVKKLPNGNILATYSTSGVIHEIDSSGNLLREITTDSIGYSEHRKTLYGPPPPFGD